MNKCDAAPTQQKIHAHIGKSQEMLKKKYELVRGGNPISCHQVIHFQTDQGEDYDMVLNAAERMEQPSRLDRKISLVLLTNRHVME